MQVGIASTSGELSRAETISMDELYDVTPAYSTSSLGFGGNSSTSMEQTNQFLPVFELVLGAVTYLVIIAMTVVQNYFLVSLAASDLAVAIVVMPLHVVKFLAGGRWLLGVTVCQLFTTADILLCTSSILNLCAIAMDRYWAIHNPIDYAQKRTPRFVGTVIVLVWLASATISVPPLIGWNDWSSQKLMDHCELTTDKTFVVFSASGSFFLPLMVMIIVYVKIFISARQRIRTNRGRSALVRISKAVDAQNQTGNSSTPRAASLVINCSANSASSYHPAGHKLKTKRSFSHSSTGFNPFKKRREASPAIRNNSDSEVAVQQAAAALFLKENRLTGGTNLNGLWVQGPHIDMDGPTKEVDDSMVSKPTHLPQTNGGSTIHHDERTNNTTRSDSSSEERSGSVVVDSTSHPVATIKAKTQFMIDDVMRKPSFGAMLKGNGGACGPQEQLTNSVLKNREKISVAKEKRAAKTIAVIIFVFIFCWLPFFCAYVILPFCESCSLHPKVHQAFVWLGYINSSLNPFLYNLNREFRRAFRKILCPKSYINAQKRRSVGGNRAAHK
uniref:G-protein coupled receptors family 1 profile domain-containing protein n=1 Tax=Ditylenchus dipsaci TaxID=166011 RepID=A0A915E6K0_9BILA